MCDVEKAKNISANRSKLPDEQGNSDFIRKRNIAEIYSVELTLKKASRNTINKQLNDENVDEKYGGYAI
ncbi:hypothetical protein ACKC5O_19705 [Aeromonas schubertii]|uniref:Uncharacterized protein n=1 Tax=Aeromonas schubertii TaxID=652 RepID=A0ABS7V648_9GAMM|nr:hypothetical protein [Aeromonas schubertii]MBZ6064857.1 hypothetical protein [Aeromonas schubertii]